MSDEKPAFQYPTVEIEQGSDDDDDVSLPLPSIFALKRKIETMVTLIFQTMGPGSKERVYQKALEQMLHDDGIVCISEKPVPYFFNGECVAVGYADIVVNGMLVLGNTWTFA
jgi:hypothetical protein